MAIAPVKVILFLLGGTVAAGTTAYVAGVFDGYLGREETVGVAEAPATPKVAELPPAQMEAQLPATDKAAQPPAIGEPADAPAVDAASNPPTQEQAGQEAQGQKQPENAPAAAESQSAPAAEADAAAGEKPQELASLPQDEPAKPEADTSVQPPSFDIVRVEADGSIVIAGRAAANAKVEAVIGSRIIGTTTAGADGNFAIVLDDPLKPGDYQIVLRATSPDGVVATSTETAVVSIPDSKDGQVLALVEEPGKPAELITVPEPKAPDATAKPAEGAAGTDASAQTPADAAAASPEEQPSEDAAAKPGEPAADQPATAGQAAAEQQPATGGEEPASAATEPAAPAADAPAAADVAAKPAASEEPAASKQDRVGPKVTVEAVEIEGRRIYIAGAADPGRLLRAYANETLLGETRASAAGRFLIEAERDLAVGDYVIRVDALEPDGAKVVARAAVPFEREPGENIAAIAPPAGAAAKPATSESNATKPAAEAPAEPAPAADNAAQQDSAAAEAASEPAPASAAEPAAEAEGAKQDRTVAEAPSEPAAQPAPETAPAASDAAAATAPATTEQPAAPAASAEAPAVEELAPKLQPVDSAVIIRRGDTLWRISHRVYGRGIRYSTIYLANQDQIRDPDLIMPGQVFKVPDRTSEGESADISKMGEQAVTPPTVQ